MLWGIIGIPTIIVMWRFLYNILANEENLEKIIVNEIWFLLNSLAVVGLQHVKAFFKK
jgi:hypothetical protein